MHFYPFPSLPQILRSLPLDAITIRVIVVEITNWERQDSQFIAEMEERGYVLFAVNAEDYIFVRHGDAFLANGYAALAKQDSAR